jgi:hypothetical protein
MISRLLALILTIPATIFGIVFALLALEEISPQTQEVRACVHNVNRETPMRGAKHVPLRPAYLVIETDRNPQKFVHYLGSIRENDAIAERIRPGDCVRITVGQAALEGAPPEETTEVGAALKAWLKHQGFSVFLAKRALKSFALGWPVIPPTNQPWVRIQRLERGNEELISPRDALMWPLVILGAISLLCLGVAARQLHRVVFGAALK